MSRILGGMALFNGVRFESEDKVSVAYYENGHLCNNLTPKIKVKIHSDIPFVRGALVLLNLIISQWRLLLILLFLEIGLLSLFAHLGPANKDISSWVLLIILLAFFLVIKLSGLTKFHAAEHKVFNAYMNGLEISMENVKKQSSVSSHCGSNLFVFLIFLMMLKIPFLISFILAYEMFKLKNIKILTPFFWLGSLFQKIFVLSEPSEKHLYAGMRAFSALNVASLKSVNNTSANS